MLTEEEYKEVREVGQSLGYLLENNLDNLEDNYEFKNAIIQVCVSYSMSKDVFRLRSDLSKLYISTDLKEKIINIVENICSLTGEKKLIFSNNVFVPDLKEFIDHYEMLRDSNRMQELYHIPGDIITSMTLEYNKYYQNYEKNSQK